MLKLLATAVLATAMLPSAAPAQEAPSSVHVAWRDLNLHSAQGIRVLDRRIASAIARVCPNEPDLGLVRNLMVIKCRKAAEADVAAQRAAVLAATTRGNVELAARADR